MASSTELMSARFPDRRNGSLPDVTCFAGYISVTFVTRPEFV